MDRYIGVKIINAEPCLGSGGNNAGKEGYCVKYEDGYISWSPKETFEKAYRKFSDKDNKITQEDVDNFIVKVEPFQLGEKTTVVQATLSNGFSLVEASACVDVRNFDMKIGTDICIEKIKDKVWFLLGFLLQCGDKGLNNN